MLPVDEGGEVAGKELGRVGDVFHFGQSSHRATVQQLLSECGVAVRRCKNTGVVHRERDDGIDRDTLMADLFGEDFDQVPGRGLAAAVNGHSRYGEGGGAGRSRSAKKRNRYTRRDAHTFSDKARQR